MGNVSAGVYGSILNSSAKVKVWLEKAIYHTRPHLVQAICVDSSNATNVSPAKLMQQITLVEQLGASRQLIAIWKNRRCSYFSALSSLAA